MAGSWPDARAAIKQRMDASVIAGPPEESLSCFEYPPAARQSAALLPYAYIVPPRVNVRRVAGQQRLMEVPEATVRIILSGADMAGADQLARRRDEWVMALADAFDGAISLGGSADVITEQVFGELVQFEPEQWWGFEMVLALRVSETRPFAVGGPPAAGSGFSSGFSVGFGGP